MESDGSCCKSQRLGWGKFLRLRVEMDITKALMRGTFLTIDGKQTWVQFKYERLPNFCLQYGVIKHSKKGCPNMKVERSAYAGQTQYGEWLCAPLAKNTGSSHKRYGGDAGQPTQEEH